MLSAFIYKNSIYLGNYICNIILGGEDGRPSGWSSSDPSRRRTSVPALNVGSLSKQKSPVANESTMTKDSMVRTETDQFYEFSFHGSD